jgi:hypothetical protein
MSTGRALYHLITDEQIVSILQGQGRAAPRVTALSRTSLAALALAGKSNHLQIETIVAAYAAAQHNFGAINRGLDEFCAKG